MDLPPFPASEPSRGRRSNGLSGGEWGALVDVDPRLSELLLERLADAAVAAWVEPAGATTDPVSRAGTLPSRPLDRLWVDAGRADDARRVVESEAEQLASRLETPTGERSAGIEQFLHPVPRGVGGRVLEPPAALRPAPSAPPSDPAPDADAAWREIVAAFSREADGPVHPWPAAEDLPVEGPDGAGGARSPTADDGGPDRVGPAGQDGGPGGAGDRPWRRRTDSAAGPDGGALPDWLEPDRLQDDGHYEPPPTPRVPRVRARTVAAAAGLVLGLLLLLTPSVLSLAPGPGSFLFGAVLAGGSVVALVAGMRDTPDEGYDPDDGAVV